MALGANSSLWKKSCEAGLPRPRASDQPCLKWRHLFDQSALSPGINLRSGLNLEREQAKTATFKDYAQYLDAFDQVGEGMLGEQIQEMTSHAPQERVETEPRFQRRVLDLYLMNKGRAPKKYELVEARLDQQSKTVSYRSTGFDLFQRSRYDMTQVRYDRAFRREAMPEASRLLHGMCCKYDFQVASLQIRNAGTPANKGD